MNCAFCELEMESRRAEVGQSIRGEFGVHEGDILLDVCPKCSRIWFDRGELSELLRRGFGGAPAERGKAVVRKTCNNCGNERGSAARREDCSFCGSKMTCCCGRCGQGLVQREFCGFQLEQCPAAASATPASTPNRPAIPRTVLSATPVARGRPARREFSIVIKGAHIVRVIYNVEFQR